MNPSQHTISDMPPLTGDAWLARLISTECSQQDRADFEDWLAASPQNALDYVEAERVHQLARELAADPGLARAARAARRDTGFAHQQKMRRWSWSLAIAAMLVLVVGGGYWGIRQNQVEEAHFATRIGEQRNVTLPDGSELILDTDSVVTTSFGRKQRLVHLESGRLHVHVAHDPARPFLVQTGNGTVRAIGTTFQVQKLAGKVVVGLLQGAIMVSTGHDAGSLHSLQLHSGQQIAYDNAGDLGEPESLDTDIAQAWTRGDLVFKNRRLDELLGDVGRYSRTRFLLADPALGKITVSGVFHIGDQQALLDTLQKGWSLRAKRTGSEEITLYPRNE